MDNRIASEPGRPVVRTVAVMAVATMLAAVVASDVVAQTPPSPTGAPNALPRTFPAPALAKTAPAKTAPVKQAKSCSSYGEGFVNVPGTDTCIKAGAYVRTEAAGHR
jgi:Porin subfamily